MPNVGALGFDCRGCYDTLVGRNKRRQQRRWQRGRHHTNISKSIHPQHLEAIEPGDGRGDKRANIGGGSEERSPPASEVLIRESGATG